MRSRPRSVLLAITGVLVLAGCGSSDGGTVAPSAQNPSTTLAVPVTTGAPAATTAPSTGASTTTTAPSAGSAVKVAANSASRADLTRAIEAAGVSNAARWAMEVEEYRPYPAGDPTFAKLRQNLTKYNPGPGVIDGIISALSL